MDEPFDDAPPAATATAASQRLPVPLTPASRLQRLHGPLLGAGVVGALTLALHFHDPHASGSWGGCPWLALTGFYCPGCGALRAVNDLTNGDVTGAASSNLLFVAMVPVVLLWWCRWAGRLWSDQGPQVPSTRHPGAWIAVFAVVTVVFTVLRNLPAGRWLAP